MQIGDARAEFYVADRKGCRANGCAAQEFEVEVDRMWLCAFGVRVLHMCARADEEGGGRVAAIGDCAYTPGVLERKGISVRGERCDGENIGESDGSHSEMQLDWRWWGMEGFGHRIMKEIKR